MGQLFHTFFTVADLDLHLSLDLSLDLDPSVDLPSSLDDLEQKEVDQGLKMKRLEDQKGFWSWDRVGMQ